MIKCLLGSEPQLRVLLPELQSQNLSGNNFEGMFV